MMETIKKGVITVRYIFTVFIVLCISACAPQAIKPDQKVEFIKIIDTNGKSKDDAFSLVEQWFSETYNSSKSVINYKDRKTGVVVGRGITRANVGMGVANNLYYNIKIEVKDGKVRFTGDGFNWVQGGSPIIYQSSLDDAHNTLNRLYVNLTAYLNKSNENDIW